MSKTAPAIPEDCRGRSPHALWGSPMLSKLDLAWLSSEALLSPNTPLSSHLKVQHSGSHVWPDMSQKGKDRFKDPHHSTQPVSV